MQLEDERDLEVVAFIKDEHQHDNTVESVQ
jgi:hypothetical protein